MTQAMESPARTRAQIPEKTLRKDPWWRQPGIVLTLLTIWVLYATVRVFMGAYYWVPRLPLPDTVLLAVCQRRVRARIAAVSAYWFPALPPIIPYAIVSLLFVLGLPAHLLLLPAGLLPGVLAVAAGVRGARAARAPTPARPGSR